MLISGQKSILKYIAVVGLLIFLYYIGALTPVKNMLTKIEAPIMKSMYYFSSKIRISFGAENSVDVLNKQVNDLNAEVVRLTEENANLKNAEEENKVLRESLKFIKNKNYRYILSNVISRGDISDSGQSTETIIIDKGARDGLYSGLGVVIGEGTLVGKIYEVEDNISKIFLTNNKKCKLAATINNEEKTSGIAEGDFGLTIKMDFIPQSSPIKIGDTVVSSGLEKNIPRGLVIGRVKKVKKESNELWQTAVIEPIINPSSLIIVGIIIPN